MAGVVVIANPNSRQNKKQPTLIPHLREILGDDGNLFATRDLSELDAAARAIRELKPDIVCFNGGDGTNHWSMSALLKVWGATPLPLFAFLRGGTMNTVCGALGISGTPEKLLTRVMDNWRDKVPLPTTEVTTLEVAGERHGFLFGTGMQANFLEVYYEGGDASPWKAVKVLSACVAASFTGGPLLKRFTERSPMTLTVDGERWPWDGYDMVGIGTVPNIAFFFRPYYRAFEDPDQFHLWAIAAGIPGVVAQLPRIATARPPSHDNIRDVLAREARFEADDILYQLDGEIFRAAGSLTVKVGRRIRVFKP